MYRKMKEGPRPCDGCGRWRWTVRCHLDAKGSGGADLGNVVLMDPTCHDQQEKRTDAWIADHGVDLWARAAEYAREFVYRP